jgi:hypothetical protein
MLIVNMGNAVLQKIWKPITSSQDLRVAETRSEMESPSAGNITGVNIYGTTATPRSRLKRLACSLQVTREKKKPPIGSYRENA